MTGTMPIIRGIPWMGLGTMIPEAKNHLEALKLSNLDWTVEKSPIFVPFKDGYQKVDNAFANQKSTDGLVLGIVTDKYKIVQNSEAFGFLDYLSEMEKEGIQYESAGQFKNGRKVWIVMKHQEFNLLGDKVQNYLTFCNSFDGSGSVRVMVTPIRMVCYNMLNLAINRATRSWSCAHMGDVNGKLQDAKSTLLLNHDYIVALQEESELLQDKKMNFTEIVERLIPITGDMTKRIQESKIEDRNLIIDLTKANDLTKFGNSAWTLVNAVSDFAFHRQPKRSSELFKEKIWDRAMTGGNLLDDAYELIKAA